MTACTTLAKPDSADIEPALATEYAELCSQVPEAYHGYLNDLSKKKP
jgi:hypothetical protein